MTPFQQIVANTLTLILVCAILIGFYEVAFGHGHKRAPQKSESVFLGWDFAVNGDHSSIVKFDKTTGNIEIVDLKTSAADPDFIACSYKNGVVEGFFQSRGLRYDTTELDFRERRSVRTNFYPYPDLPYVHKQSSPDNYVFMYAGRVCTVIWHGDLGMWKGNVGGEYLICFKLDAAGAIAYLKQEIDTQDRVKLQRTAHWEWLKERVVREASVAKAETSLRCHKHNLTAHLQREPKY